ncbi:hypothetical protein [Paraburkholderia youngii]|uniref:hypothetical protein n=1 Tax=Paraburkholderia youngii TaxID=2782701 RepID=UPI001591F58B|nr:hypothetical protein [Paraburkholderia youngii]NUX58679.1 hypothetical protein [Paraburkholderia youngii]
MAKQYDFRFIVREAQFNLDGSAAVVFGGSSTVYHESSAYLTFAEAQRLLRMISAREARPHCAFVSMKYSSDRKPPGFNTTQTHVYGGAGAGGQVAA